MKGSMIRWTSAVVRSPEATACSIAFMSARTTTAASRAKSGAGAVAYSGGPPASGAPVG